MNRPTFTLIFSDRKTEKVMYAISEVTLIRYITMSEVGFVDHNGHIRSASFTQAENLEIERVDPS